MKNKRIHSTPQTVDLTPKGSSPKGRSSRASATGGSSSKSRASRVPASGGSSPKETLHVAVRQRRPSLSVQGQGRVVDSRIVLGAFVLLVALIVFVGFAFVKQDSPISLTHLIQSASGEKVEQTNVSSSAQENPNYTDGKWEYWRATATEALEYFGGDKRLADLVLTMIYVESGGNADVDYYHDIMEAREGDTLKIITTGEDRKGIPARTPEASIYAGVAILVDAADDFRRYLGRQPDPDNANDMALLAQGYNYGHRGWFLWLQKNGIGSWSLEASQNYQATIGGVGTANHGQKVMDAYPQFHK